MCLSLSLYIVRMCSTGTLLLPGSGFLGPTQYCCWDQVQLCPKPTLLCWGHSGLGARLLPDQFLGYGISHYCWGTGLVRYCHQTFLFTQGWHTTVSVHTSFFGSAKLPGPTLVQIRLGAEGPLREEAAGFPVEGPPLEQRQLRWWEWVQLFLSV